MSMGTRKITCRVFLHGVFSTIVASARSYSVARVVFAENDAGTGAYETPPYDLFRHGHRGTCLGLLYVDESGGSLGDNEQRGDSR